MVICPPIFRVNTKNELKWTDAFSLFLLETVVVPNWFCGHTFLSSNIILHHMVLVALDDFVSCS